MATATLSQASDIATNEPIEMENSLLLYKALADQLRLQILRLLKNESFGVLEICRILNIRQSALSHHLKILANASLVSTRREGNSIFYRRAFVAIDDKFRDIKKSAYKELDRTKLNAEHYLNVQQIQLERSRLSLNFFNKNANQFREQQGLIVKHQDYSSALLDVVDSIGLATDAPIMEVGPGEGLLLVELAEKYSNLTALDNSAEMLEKARQTSQKEKISNLHFILGDTQIAKKLDAQYDLIIFDMVLHHISSPAETFNDCKHLLTEGGYLLIADLSTHDQDWVRESCGDLWLGFDESDLEDWAEQAQLEPGDGEFLGLRNGFQIQLHVFKKGHL